MAERSILGISPGTRIIGLAVIMKGELVEWRVKSFKEAWSKEKRLAILAMIRKMCEYHNVWVVSMKKVDPTRSSPQLDRLILSISKLCGKDNIRYRTHALSELDYDLITGKRQNKDDLAASVAEKHPELRHEYERERNSRGEYHTRMFEAVAIAELEQRKSI